MHIPSSSKEPQRTHISVFHGTHTYLNDIVKCLVDDYNKVFEAEGEGAEVMHMAKRSDEDYYQTHLFLKSTTNEKLFGIDHRGPGKTYLLL